MEACRQVRTKVLPLEDLERRRLQQPNLRFLSTESSSLCERRIHQELQTLEERNIFTSQKILRASKNGIYSSCLKPIRFKKLTVEERINALSTVNPHFTETLINMYKKNDSG